MRNISFSRSRTEDFIAYLNKHLPDAVERIDLDTWIYAPGFPEDAPVFSSGLLEAVEGAVEGYSAGHMPNEQDLKRWTPAQKELFLQLIPGTVPAADCRMFKVLLGLEASQNKQLLTAYLLTAIRSECVEVMPEVEELLAHVGRGLFVRALFRTLASTEWSRDQARPLFEKFKERYHPIVQAGVTRVLEQAGV